MVSMPLRTTLVYVALWGRQAHCCYAWSLTVSIETECRTTTPVKERKACWSLSRQKVTRLFDKHIALHACDGLEFQEMMYRLSDDREANSFSSQNYIGRLGKG